MRSASRRIADRRPAIVLALALGATISTLSCARVAQESGAQQTEQADTPAPRFAYEDLVALINTGGLTSIEQVLPALPLDLRSNYVLMHDSRSLQAASYQSPRAILFGTDGRLTCAFNGDPAEAGFDKLECFQFREAERAFDFRQIQFPTAANGLAHVEFSASNQSADGKVRCTGCHTADPRPNWDSYSVWPGAYGSSDDSIDNGTSDGSEAHYAAFVARRATDPRYRWLVQGTHPDDPFMSADGTGVGNRPNLRFSDACGRMNALRATRLLAARLAPWRSVAFAVKALGCTLSPAQLTTLGGAGIHVDSDLDLATIFAAAGVPSPEWTTRVFNDVSTTPTQPWEHQGGFSFLSYDVAMVVAQDRARAGNQALQQGLDKVVASFATAYTGAELAFFSALNQLVPDPDRFGVHFADNTDDICPALTQELVTAVTQPH